MVIRSLTSEAVGSTLNLSGSTVVVILPRADLTTISFTWDSEATEGSSIPTLASYIIASQDGELGWNPRRRQEKLWWIIDNGQSLDDAVEFNTKADLTGCDRSQPCTCFSFQASEISNDGYLVEITQSVYL